MDTLPQNTTPQVAQQPLATSGGGGNRKGKKGNSKQGRGWRALFVISIVIVMLCAAAVTWLITSHRLLLTWTDGLSGGQVQAVAHIVCDDEAVSIYNEGIQNKVRAGSSTPSYDAEKLKRLAAEIKTHNGYQNDPTCQNILFWQALRDGDAVSANDALTGLRALNSKHLYPNNGLGDIMTFSAYDEMVKSIPPRDASSSPQQDSAQ